MDTYPSPFDMTNDVDNNKNRCDNSLHNNVAIDSKTTTSQEHNITTTTTTTTTLDTSSSEGEENDLNFVVPRQSLYPQSSLLSSSVLSSTYRVPRQRRRCSHRINYTKGLWSEFEQRQFLTGLMIYGWGQWKEIGIIIPTRSNQQIKSHAQKVAQKHYDGNIDIFEPLIQHHHSTTITTTEMMYPPRCCVVPTIPPTIKSNNITGTVENEVTYKKDSNMMAAEILCTLRQPVHKEYK